MQDKQGRNQKCACGSGRKYKKCCGLTYVRPQIGLLAPVPEYTASPKCAGAPPRDGCNWRINVDSQSKGDLDLLIKALQNDDIRAYKIGDQVWVDWEMLRPYMPFDRAACLAQEFFPVLNGLLATRIPVFMGLRLRGICGTSSESQQIRVSWTSLAVPGLREIHRTTEYLRNPNPSIGSLYRLARSNSAVGEALLYFGHGGEPFFDLYKAFEVVRDTVGGEGQLCKLGLASKRDCGRFTRSANDPAISGVFARHSQRRSEPAADPMEVNEAKEFVRSILHRWTDQLLQETERSDATRMCVGM